MNWISNMSCVAFKTSLLILFLGVSLNQNRDIFQDKPSQVEQSMVDAMPILAHFSQEKGASPPRMVIVENIEYHIPWEFFDGASINSQWIKGGGFILSF